MVPAPSSLEQIANFFFSPGKYCSNDGSSSDALTGKKWVQRFFRPQLKQWIFPFCREPCNLCAWVMIIPRFVGVIYGFEHILRGVRTQKQRDTLNNILLLKWITLARKSSATLGVLSTGICHGFSFHFLNSIKASLHNPAPFRSRWPWTLIKRVAVHSSLVQPTKPR